VFTSLPQAVKTTSMVPGVYGPPAPSAAGTCCIPPAASRSRSALPTFVRIEDFSNQALVSHLSIKTHAVRVLPCTPWFDVQFPIPTLPSRFRSALPTNSGPLSDRIFSGISHNRLSVNHCGALNINNVVDIVITPSWLLVSCRAKKHRSMTLWDKLVGSSKSGGPVVQPGEAEPPSESKAASAP
jgi:hypothetical protein